MVGDLRMEADVLHHGPHDEVASYSEISEEITIPIGQGAEGVLSVADLCPADSIIVAVVGRVTQAPGGGPTIWHCGRNPVGPYEFGNNIPVALGTTFISTTDSDGTHAGSFYNGTATKIEINCGNVNTSDMKVRVTVFYIKLYPPEE